MKILAPVNSLESCKAQIEAGAEEIYLGMITEIYDYYSFSARCQKNARNESIALDKSQLKEIVRIAHENKVIVNHAANMPYFSDFIYGKVKVQDEFIKYINEVVECGVDNLIVGDIGLLYLLGKMKLPVGLHASTYFDTINIEQLLLLKELGASRCCLTYQVGLEEIEKFCQSNIMEIEVFAYLGCSSYSGSCNLSHGWAMDNREGDIAIGLPCKSKYKVWSDKLPETKSDFLDSELGCALCSLFELNKIGVEVIKIVGREFDGYTMSQITRMFTNANHLSLQGTNEDYLMKLKDIRYVWWKKVWCNKNSCKYSNNFVMGTYVGRV